MAVRAEPSSRRQRGLELALIDRARHRWLPMGSVGLRPRATLGLVHDAARVIVEARHQRRAPPGELRSPSPAARPRRAHPGRAPGRRWPAPRSARARALLASPSRPSAGSSDCSDGVQRRLLDRRALRDRSRTRPHVVVAAQVFCVICRVVPVARRPREVSRSSARLRSVAVPRRRRSPCSPSAEPMSRSMPPAPLPPGPARRAGRSRRGSGRLRGRDPRPPAAAPLTAAPPANSGSSGASCLPMMTIFSHSPGRRLARASRPARGRSAGTAPCCPRRRTLRGASASGRGDRARG